MKLQEELVSSCALVLNAMGMIRDPVRLYANLAGVFGPRGWCLFGVEQVEKAFLRLQGDAIRMGKSAELWKAAAKIGNPHINTLVSNKLPEDDLLELIGSENLAVRKNASKALYPSAAPARGSWRTSSITPTLRLWRGCLYPST